MLGSKRDKQASAEGRLDLVLDKARVAAQGLWLDAAGTCGEPAIEPLPHRLPAGLTCCRRGRAAVPLGSQLSNGLLGSRFRSPDNVPALAFTGYRVRREFDDVTTSGAPPDL
jgi:hypothetical protein